MADLLTLTCPSCGANLQPPPYDVFGPAPRRLVCEYCGAEHVLQPPVLSPSKTGGEPAARPPVPLPESIRYQKFENGLRLVRRWFSWKYIPMMFFSIAWDAFLLFWYSMAFSTHAPWIFVIFPIAHLAVGVGLTYATLAGFLNRSVIEITPDKFEVYHDPLPWSGELKLPTRELGQIYCQEVVQHGKNGATTTYELCAVLKNGRKKTLLKGLDSPDIGLFLEQQIEKWLRIADRPVGGELARGL
jgi:hypothetical protein